MQPQWSYRKLPYYKLCTFCVMLTGVVIKSRGSYLPVRWIESRATETRIRLLVKIPRPLSLKNLIELLESLSQFFDFRGHKLKKRTPKYMPNIYNLFCFTWALLRNPGKEVPSPHGAWPKGSLNESDIWPAPFLLHSILTWLFPPNSPAEISSQPLHPFRGAVFKASERLRIAKFTISNCQRNVRENSLTSRFVRAPIQLLDHPFLLFL